MGAAKIGMISAIILSLIVDHVQGWCAFEHALVASLATTYMHENSVKVLDTILQDCPWKQAYPTMSNVASASAWADFIRNDRKNKGEGLYFKAPFVPPKNGFWHFTNVPFECHPENPGPPILDLSELPLLERLTEPGNPYDTVDNAAYILERAIKEWKHPTSKWHLNVLLRYFIHSFVDIHQPMHASQAKSLWFPDGDNGGVCWHFENSKDFGFKNLHYVWDRAAGAYGDKHWDPAEGHLADQNDLELDKEILRLFNVDMPKEMITMVDWEHLNSMEDELFFEQVEGHLLFRQIIEESNIIVQQEAYSDLAIPKRFREQNLQTSKPRFPRPSNDYMLKVRDITQGQLVKAAKRLGLLLEKMANIAMENEFADLN